MVRVVEQIPEAAPVAHLVQALLGVPTLEHASRWAELAWLSGRESRASEEGVNAGVLGDGDVLHVLAILATLAAPIAPIAIVFDQLENLASACAERVLGYGNVVSELVDSVPCLTIVQLALTSEWLQFIEPHLSLAQRLRVAGDKHVLALPSEKERKLLLRAWKDRLSPPLPTAWKRRFGHPLSPEELEVLLTAPGTTPRLLATAYARAVAGKEIFEAIEPTSAIAEPPGLVAGLQGGARQGRGGARGEGARKRARWRVRDRRRARRRALIRRPRRGADAHRARSPAHERPLVVGRARRRPPRRGAPSLGGRRRPRG